MGTIGTLLLTGLLFLALLMVAVWGLSLVLRNAGIVDVAWSASFVPVVAGYVWLADGWLPRALVMLAIVTLWSLRLASHLWVRVAAEHPHEDSRYAALRAAWGPSANARMLAFFEVQAVAALVLTVPFAIAATNATPAFSWIEWVGMAVWAVGFTGEAIADRQLARFRGIPANKGRVCQEGLWRYSRHPNYFFEWLIWVAYALFALASPWGAVALLCPALMLYLLFRVTGIPATEAQAIRSKGDDYRRYQATTSVFVPWFPRSAS
jgi:steroid 5-alpha reductase family enzyme